MPSIPQVDPDEREKCCTPNGGCGDRSCDIMGCCVDDGFGLRIARLERERDAAIAALSEEPRRVKALERLAGCPPNCRNDDYPGCGICMSSAESLEQMTPLTQELEASRVYAKLSTAALVQVEAVMTIVEPRSHSCEYLSALDAARAALAKNPAPNELCNAKPPKATESEAPEVGAGPLPDDAPAWLTDAGRAVLAVNTAREGFTEIDELVAREEATPEGAARIAQARRELAAKIAAKVGCKVVPEAPSTAMLRPFMGCPDNELELGYQAMLHIADVEQRRAVSVTGLSSDG